MQTVRIVKTVEETPSIRSLFFDLDINPVPGQFVMVWIPGCDEKPMAVSHDGELKGITVFKRGDATSELLEKKEGDWIGIRGPYGRGFEVNGSKLVLVGGGIGMAPLAPLAELALSQGRGVTAVVGARTGGELLFVDRLQRAGAEVIVTTKDGSSGIKGLVTAGLESALEGKRFDQCFTCGPEAMMVEVLGMAKENGIPAQASLERYFKCGIGVCGSCAIDESGARVCVEGPVFTDRELEAASEFGKYKRDSTGKRVSG